MMRPKLDFKGGHIPGRPFLFQTQDWPTSQNEAESSPIEIDCHFFMESTD
jgi:hypothetical protein